jgi:hypothetical protein
MTQRVQVLLEDDLTGGPAENTVRFGIDDATYEIDLNGPNTSKLRETSNRSWNTHANPTAPNAVPVAPQDESAAPTSAPGRSRLAFMSTSESASQPTSSPNTKPPTRHGHPAAQSVRDLQQAERLRSPGLARLVARVVRVTWLRGRYGAGCR